MRQFRNALPVLAVTALLALAVWSLCGPFSYLAASRWRAELDEAPAGQADLLAGRMAQLGKPGIHALVDALDSDREVTATAARRALWAELKRWESLSARVITKNLAVLAEALAQGTEPLRPAACRDAANLATEILRWLPESDAPDRLAIIANCDRVFEYAAADRHAVASMAAARSPGRAAAAQARSADQPESTPAEPLLEKPDMPATLSTVPGGGLPIETLPIPGIEAHSRAESTADRRSRASESEPPGAVEGESTPRLITPGELFLPEGIRPLSAAEPFPSAPGPPVVPMRIADPSARAASEPEPDEKFDSMEMDVLMRWLHSADATVAARAEAVLRRRGFTDVQVELARRLFDADTAVRIELARTLPRLTSIDPVPWLLWLSRDPAAEVRLAAISLMATTGDPALHARIRQMAREDSDAAVQRVARRLDER